jgi:predicted HicB family RNase H-like nuclease
MEAERKPPPPVARFNLRLDRDLHRALVVEATRAERSLAREIRFRLRQSLTKRPVVPSAPGRGT